MNMKKYIVNFYEVEEDSWNLRNYFTIDGSELAKTIQGIESRGFRLSMSNIFVKTFTSDIDQMHMCYVIIEIPSNL
nr:MAG TPA: hypothetical protein [Microviridae sp.]